MNLDHSGPPRGEPPPVDQGEPEGTVLTFDDFVRRLTHGRIQDGRFLVVAPVDARQGADAAGIPFSQFLRVVIDAEHSTTPHIWLAYDGGRTLPNIVAQNDAAGQQCQGAQLLWAALAEQDHRTGPVIASLKELTVADPEFALLLGRIEGAGGFCADCPLRSLLTCDQ